jgi:hypothetical protein
MPEPDFKDRQVARFQLAALSGLVRNCDYRTFGVDPVFARSRRLATGRVSG